MTKEIKEHEEINLHIRKTTFYVTLRSIFIIPLGIYFMASQWYGTNIKWNCQGWDCIQWHDWGMLLNSFALSIIIVIFVVWFISGGRFNMIRGD